MMTNEEMMAAHYNMTITEYRAYCAQMDAFDADISAASYLAQDEFVEQRAAKRAHEASLAATAARLAAKEEPMYATGPVWF
jgi:hypothetical protein